MATYTCCGCDTDMTPAIECLNAGDIVIAIAPDEEPPEELLIELTCPNDHTCGYLVPLETSGSGDIQICLIRPGER